jgi:hypothetical protein
VYVEPRLAFICVCSLRRSIAARVPIVKLETKLGFEADIAIGGHNGTDTSFYAAAQAEKYKSFAPVILFLKVIMAQQRLDVPFQGGMGSYKLYVLLAHHIEKHLEFGGQDRPGEILFSFFFRYGNCSKDVQESRREWSTVLTKQMVLKDKDGAIADLSNVFLMDYCVSLFRKSYKRMRDSFEEPANSFLRVMVDVPRLKQERSANYQLAEASLEHLQTSPKRKTHEVDVAGELPTKRARTSY